MASCTVCGRTQQSRAARGNDLWLCASPKFEAQAMDPLIRPDAIVLVDRHYNSLAPYRQDRPNIFAVRHGPHLLLRHVDFLANRLVLRPYGRAFPVELMELGLHEAPGDLIAGRVALIVNEM